MKVAIKQVMVALVLIIVTLLVSSCSRDPQKIKMKYLASGQTYMKKGEYASAAIEFRNALKTDPRFADAYYQLAQADLAQHDWTGAYASLEKTIDLDPNRMDARLDRGRLYLGARQFDKAEDDANYVILQNPKDVGAYQLLASALIGEKKSDQALPAFSKVTELMPTDASAFVNLAMVEFSLHHLADAEQHFKQAIVLNSKSIQAILDLANFYHLQSKYAEAKQVLQAGIQNNPDAPLLYIDWADILSSEKKTADAEGVLDKLRTQMPKSAEAAIAIGDFYSRRNDTDKALAEYRRGLSASDNNLDIKKRIEDLYLATNQKDQAAEIDSQLTKQASKDVIVRVNHGRLLMAQGKLLDTVIQLQKVAKDAADSPQAHYYLALAYWQNGSLGEASSELQEALRLSPGMPNALQSLAQLNLSQGNTSAAQLYGQELVQKFPAEVSYRLLLGAIYLRAGLPRPAEEQFLAAKLLAPNQAAVHLDLGQLYSVEKKWTEATKELETALQLDPLNATILSGYADFLVAHQQLPKAIARVQQFVTANPSNAQGHVILGALQFQAKNNGAAQAEFERAIQLNPNDVQAYLRIGQVYQSEKQTDAAISQYQKALALQPKFVPLCTMIGNLYLDKGDLKTARQYYQKALDLDPNFAIANANMAWVDAQEGQNLDVALGMAQKAKSEMPDLPSITDTLAWVMYKKGNYSGAIPLLQECIEKVPNKGQYHYHLGMALVAAGEKQKGKTQLQAALETKQLRSEDTAQARQTLSQVE